MEISKKPYIGVLFIEFMFASRALFNKAAVSQGMNPCVFVFYRQAFASLSLAPFAFFLERKSSATLSFNLLCKIFFVSLFGITVCLDLDSLSFNYISATFTVAISTIVPAITFVMAVCLRMESISIKKWHGGAKVLGSAVSLLGALVFILVQGPPLYSVAASLKEISPLLFIPKGDSLKGFLAAIASDIAWAGWIIMQAPLVKEYPALLRLTALQTFFSCIQAAIWAAAVERNNLAAWKLGWDLNLLSVAYCGFIFTGVTNWSRLWVIEKKGPVFLAMFTPLSLLLTAFLSAILWKEVLHWGSVCGAVLLLGGLYGFLWGQHTEKQKEKKIEQKPDAAIVETSISLD